MKKLHYLISALLIVLVVTNGCKKDDDKDSSNENILKESYFTVENGVFKNETFPAASNSGNAPVINSVFGNSSVLEGGSNPVSIQTVSSVADILLGVEGKKGYYAIPSSDLKSTDDMLLVIILFSQSFEQDSFVILVALRNSEGMVSVHESIAVTKIEAGTGTLQVSCSWDKPNDVDLHLVEPGDEEIYYGMSQSENGGLLDVDSNAGCFLDNINNENITYSSESIVENGSYIVRIDLFSNCDVPSSTNFVVSVRYQGQLITPTSGTNPYTGTFNPGDEDHGGLGDGRQVMKFAISSSKDADLNQKRMKLVYSKSNKVLSPDKLIK